MLKKSASFLLIIILLITMLGTFDSFAGAAIPGVENMLYSDDFSAASLNSKIVPTTVNNGTTTGTVKLVNGELEINKNSNTSGWTGVDIYLNENHSAVTEGEYVTQFKLRRFSSKPTIQVRARSSKGSAYTGVTWGNGDSVVSGFYCSDEKDTVNGGFVQSSAFGSETALTVTIHYNLAEQTFSMWLDDDMVLSDKYSQYSEAADLSCIRIYSEFKGAKFYVDDFKYYSVDTNSAYLEVTGISRTIDGESSKSLIGGKTVDTVVSVKRSNKGTALVFSALYTKINGVKCLEKVFYDELEFEGNGELTSKTLSVGLPDDITNYILETFVFDSWDDIAPAKWLVDNTPLTPTVNN